LGPVDGVNKAPFIRPPSRNQSPIPGEQEGGFMENIRKQIKSANFPSLFPAQVGQEEEGQELVASPRHSEAVLRRGGEDDQERRARREVRREEEEFELQMAMALSLSITDAENVETPIDEEEKSETPIDEAEKVENSIVESEKAETSIDEAEKLEKPINNSDSEEEIYPSSPKRAVAESTK
jgi:hypothetical protein